MGVLEVACACGHRLRVPETAFGMTLPCPACGAGLYVSLSTLARPSGGAAPESPSPRPPSPAEAPPVLEERCARCNRSFRGDWDRCPTDDGVVCHICAKQAPPGTRSDAAPEPVPTKPAGPAVRRMMMPEYTQVTPYIIDEPKRTRKRDPRKIKRDAIILGVAFLVTMAIIAFLPVEELASRGEWKPSGEVSRVWGVVVFAIRLLAMFAGAYIAYYIVLDKANKLPNETFVGNLLAIGPPVAGLSVMALLPMPAPFGCALLTLYLCFFVYELSLSDFVELLIFGVLANILVAALTPLIYFLIALVAL